MDFGKEKFLQNFEVLCIAQLDNRIHFNYKIYRQAGVKISSQQTYKIQSH